MVGSAVPAAQRQLTGAFVRQHQVQKVQKDQRRHEVSRHEAELVQVQLAPDLTDLVLKKTLLGA